MGFFWKCNLTTYSSDDNDEGEKEGKEKTFPILSRQLSPDSINDLLRNLLLGLDKLIVSEENKEDSWLFLITFTSDLCVIVPTPKSV